MYFHSLILHLIISLLRHFASSHRGSVWSVAPCQCGQWPYQRCVLSCSVGVAQRQKQVGSDDCSWNGSMRRFIRTAKKGLGKRTLCVILCSSKCHEWRCQQEIFLEFVRRSMILWRSNMGSQSDVPLKFHIFKPFLEDWNFENHESHAEKKTME